MGLLKGCVVEEQRASSVFLRMEMINTVTVIEAGFEGDHLQLCICLLQWDMLIRLHSRYVGLIAHMMDAY